MESFNSISKQAEAIVQPALRNPYLMAVLKITLALYAAQLAPRLPAPAVKIFENTFVKIIAIAMIAYLSERDFQLAIILAVAYVVGINVVSGRGILESFSDFSNNYKTHGNAKLIEPKSVLYPGCQNVTLADLQKAFDGDNIKLHTTVQFAYGELLSKANNKNAKETLMKMAYAVGLPYNIDMSKEENAPLIATMLMYAGFNIGTTCIPPQQ